MQLLASNTLISSRGPSDFYITYSPQLEIYWDLATYIDTSIDDDCGPYMEPAFTLATGPLDPQVFTIDQTNKKITVNTSYVSKVGTYTIVLSTGLQSYSSVQLIGVEFHTISITDNSIQSLIFDSARSQESIFTRAGASSLFIFGYT